MRCVLGMLVCLFGLTLPGAQAQPPQGAIVSGSVVLNGRAVPLPPGEWKVIASEDGGRAPDFAGALSQARGSWAILTQDQAERLSGVIAISASERSSYTYSNWQVMACARPPSSAGSMVREGGETHQNCADVRVLAVAPQRPANVARMWGTFFDAVYARPGWSPAIFYTGWSRVADRTGSLDVIYHFSPETRGFARDDRPWAQNGWNPANQNDAQKAYIVRIADWLRDTHARARRGFLYGSTDPALPF